MTETPASQVCKLIQEVARSLSPSSLAVFLVILGMVGEKWVVKSHLSSKAPVFRSLNCTKNDEPRRSRGFSFLSLLL